MRINLDINGEQRELDVEPRTSLLDCLRDHAGLTGAHTGCEHGVCGACTVLFDGVAVRSCLIFAPQAEGSKITTIEGVTPGPGEMSVIQDAFCETHGMQCGYCTPAMILVAHALLIDNPNPTREEIVDAISGNICRCTGYAQIIDAVALAASARTAVSSPARASSSPTSICRTPSTSRWSPARTPPRASSRSTRLRRSRCRASIISSTARSWPKAPCR